jgi:hypothetical protein
MHPMMHEINWQPSRRDLRQFARIWVPLFAALAGSVVVFRYGAWNTAITIWAVAVAIAAIGVARPQLVKPIFVGLTIAAYPIGWTVSHVVLAVIYYGLFTTIGLIMRAVRYDPLQRRRGRSLGTYWMPHDQPPEPGAYFRQF